MPTGTLEGLKPASAKRGATLTMKITPGGIMAPPEFIQPTSVSIGVTKARKITWDGATVTAEFVLPDDAKDGALDVKVVFPGPPGSGFSVTFVSKGGFSVK